MIEVTCNEAPIFAEILNRNSFNIIRISKLLDEFGKTNNQDLLKMCVVYLHASAEDVLRNVFYYHLLFTDQDSLNDKIPLVGSDGKKEKFTLHDLKQYKSKTVEELLADSFEEYVSRLTFNNTNDIIHVFNKFKIDHKEIEPLLTKLQTIFSRRHLIVHNFDLKTQRRILNKQKKTFITGDYQTEGELNSETVREWLDIISQFLFLTTKRFLPKGMSITMQNV